MKLSIFYSLFIFIFFCINLPSQAQKNNTNVELNEAKQSINNSEKRYEEAKKNIFRAKEKLNHYKKSKKLSFNELQQKENTLSKAEQKLKKMAQLIEHNKVLLLQLKTNPSLGKSIKLNEKISNTKNNKANATAKPKSKSQQHTLADKVLQEKQLRRNKSKEQLKKAIKNKQNNNSNN